MSDVSFLIISGTSGSGKTIALQVLEDLGYYCIDNLPASLLVEMASRAIASESKIKRYAISIDSRNQDIVGDLKGTFSTLDSLNIKCRLIFVDADESVLLNRYSETRRKHPLSNKHTSLVEAINAERQLLEHLADIADLRLDTSSTTPHELRSKIRNYAADDEASLTLLFQSFGFKYGNPSEADFVFDVRCLPNPHWDPKLKPLSGLDLAVQEYLGKNVMCLDMFQKIRDFVEYWLPQFINDNRNYITVAIGCTGGQHRSVFMSTLLCEYFSKSNLVLTQVRHRELDL